MSPWPRIEKLGRHHILEGFDCGNAALNLYLTRFAWQNQQAGASRTYLALEGERIVGFYSLAVGEIGHEGAAARITKGLARHPVPVMLLTRLAVSRDRQGRKLGAGLLRDAMLRTLQAADLAGIRAFVVHAKDESARAFYARYDFEPSPSDPFHLHVPLKDIRALVGSPS